MQPTPANIEMRQLIRTKSRQPDGFCLSDARGMAGEKACAQNLVRLRNMGELIRVKVAGHLMRYVHTQAQADALRARLHPITSDRLPDAKINKLRLRVIEKAKTPEGATSAEFATSDLCRQAFFVLTARAVKDGQLFGAFVRGHLTHYFVSAQAAADWRAATPVKLPLKLQAKLEPKAPKVVTAKPPKPKKPKPPKVAKVKAVKPVKILKTSRPQLAKPANLSIGEITFLRQAASKLPVLSTIRKDAAIVYPKGYKFSSRPMMDRHAVAVPFVRIGQPGWSMSVGAR